MKKVFLSAILIGALGAANAQGVDEGTKHLYYHRYASAENTFKNVVAQQPDNGAAWVGLTKTYLVQEQPDKAAAALRSAPENAVNNPQYQAAYGSLLLVEGKADSAATYFDKALRATKEKDAAVLMTVAEAHIVAKSGDANKALELLDKAAKRDKRNPAIDVLKGNAYRKLGNGGEAFRAYNEALAKDANYAEAHYQLGDIFLSQKNAEMYVEHFEKAVAADAAYAPALEKLYAYQFYRDPAKAKQYYDQYLANTDTSINNHYDLADLLYIGKDYDKAIEKANYVMSVEGDAVQPRIYKLIGYSYAGLKDTAQALTYMQQYFEKAPDSMVVAKDYSSMADFLLAQGNDSLAAEQYALAVTKEEDSTALYGYYQKLAEMAAARKDFSEQAKWLHRFYEGNKDASNLDLFNVGLAYFRAENYEMADSIYGQYTEKYPDQSFGFYWQAKSKALLDPEMEQGLAVPVYQTLIEKLQANTEDPNYQKWMVEAYGYLAAYEANSQKNYQEAIGYFQKILEVDPENADAKKYIEVLEKDTKKSAGK